MNDFPILLPENLNYRLIRDALLPLPHSPFSLGSPDIASEELVSVQGIISLNGAFFFLSVVRRTVCF